LFLKFIPCDYNVNYVHNFSLNSDFFLGKGIFCHNFFSILIARNLIILVSLAKLLFLVAISSQTIKGFHCLFTCYKKKLPFIIKSLSGCSLVMF
jgi:hypothetical protein